MNNIYVTTSDPRSDYRTDQYFPQRIFLFTVLRLVVFGTAYASETRNVSAEKQQENIDNALASVGTFLAQQIEVCAIPIFNAHTLLPVVDVELAELLSRLRSMDGGSNLLGLAGEHSLNYHLDGEKLYNVVTKLNPNIDVNYIVHKLAEKGDSIGYQERGLWAKLIYFIPEEWRLKWKSAHDPAPDPASAKPVDGAPLVLIANTVTTDADKPLSTRERNILLTIIAVLCKEAKLDYSKPAKTAVFIRDMAERMGWSIGESTIENHLKKIPDAIETRMK